MPSLWVVQRDLRQREALARLAGVLDTALLAGPDDRALESRADASVVVLGVEGDFERELDFVHRLAPRLPGARWVLVAPAADHDEVRRLFDAVRFQLLAYPPDSFELRRQLRQALSHRSAEPLSARMRREATAERFARWLADVELPDLLRALDPRAGTTPLLVRGERGTGRGLVARYAHAFGRPGGRFVSVGCDGVTGAAELLAELADLATRAALDVTLCLEDVDRLPPRLQKQVRGWIEGGLPEGALLDHGVRWMATGGDPASAPDRLDPGLRDALAGVEVRVPPLRERPAAIPALAADAALAWCRSRGEPLRRFSPEAIEVLRAYPWPGNARELEALVARTLAAGPPDPIRAPDLRFEVPVALAEQEPDLEEPSEPAPLEATPAEPRSEAAPAEAGREAAPGFARRLATAVAHEIGNPLTGLRTFADLLPERFADPEFRARFAEVVGGDLRRLESVVDRLRRFGDLGEPEREAVDLAALLDAALAARRGEIERRRIIFLEEIERAKPHVLGDAEQLRLVVDLLLDRALAWLPDRGDVYLASKHHPPSESMPASARVLLRLRGARVPEVSDTPGFRPTETALDLAVADALVRAGGGRLAVSSSEGRDTVLVLDLPAPPA